MTHSGEESVGGKTIARRRVRSRTTGNGHHFFVSLWASASGSFRSPYLYGAERTFLSPLGGSVPPLPERTGTNGTNHASRPPKTAGVIRLSLTRHPPRASGGTGLKRLTYLAALGPALLG